MCNESFNNKYNCAIIKKYTCAFNSSMGIILSTEVQMKKKKKKIEVKPLFVINPCNYNIVDLHLYI